MVNRAIRVFGTWVENELSKTDKQGRPRRKLADIIENGAHERLGSAEMLIAMVGME